MNILLSSAGRRNYLVDYFREAVKPYGGKVFVTNSVPETAAMIAADKGFCVPQIKDPEYIPTLLSICEKHEIKLVVPLFDHDLNVLADAISEFEARNILVLVSKINVIQTCRDKSRICEFLSQNDLRFPKTYLGLDLVHKALDQKEIGFPLIVKPRWGMGSIGVTTAYQVEELELVYKQVKRKIKDTYLAFDPSREPTEDVVIQEKLSGVEYALDVVNDLNGHYVTTFVKRKLAMHNGETDIACMVEDPQLENMGKKLGESLSHIGTLDVDVIVAGNVPFILDVNPRFGGGYPFSHLAGANLPAAFVAWALGKEAHPDWLRVKAGIIGCKGILPLTGR